MKKKHLILIGAGILLLFLAVVLFDCTKYVCRVVTDADISQLEEMANAEAMVPFISNSERDRLFDKIVHKEMKSFSDPITIEIEDQSWVMCDGKEALWYLLSVKDADGFATSFGVIIHARW